MPSPGRQGPLQGDGPRTPWWENLNGFAEVLGELVTAWLVCPQLTLVSWVPKSRPWDKNLGASERIIQEVVTGRAGKGMEQRAGSGRRPHQSPEAASAWLQGAL